MWTLVVLVYAGALAKGDSVTLTHIPNWQSEQACVAAGSALKPLVSGSFKELKFVCIKNN